MNKLTAEKCREMFFHLFEEKRQDGITLKEDFYLQALEIALPVLEQQENQCEKCNGTGQMDSGGTQPWGESILVTCDCQPPTDTYRQIENDGWIEWSGGEIPVAENMVVRVRYRGDFQEDKCLAGSMIWEHSGEEDDIIAYRVIENDGREG